MQSVEDFRYKLHVLHLQTFVMERQDKNNTSASEGGRGDILRCRK